MGIRDYTIPAQAGLPHARQVWVPTSDGERLGAWHILPAAQSRRVAMQLAAGMAGDAAFDGALNANTMNAKYGGGQKTPRSSTIPTDPEKAALFLGPYDPKLKPGDTQYFYFREGDAPPFYKPNTPKHDTVLCLPSPPSPTPL